MSPSSSDGCRGGRPNHFDTVSLLAALTDEALQTNGHTIYVIDRIGKDSDARTGCVRIRR